MASPAMQLTIKAARGAFFDRERVQRGMDAATHKVLSKFGAYVRTRARTSLRKRKGASAPGTPPHSHGLHLLRNWILFSYDRDRKTVVIGPALLTRGTGAPRISEYGGTGWGLVNGKRARVAYPPRPYMRPAFNEELRRMPPDWRNRLR